MEFKWREDRFSCGRVDIDITSEHGGLIGFFKEYEIKGCSEFIWSLSELRENQNVDLTGLPLEEAKAVVEAMILLEGKCSTDQST